MKRTAMALLLTLTASTAFAVDDAMVSSFLRAYVKTLCAEKSGDRRGALAAIAPFESGGPVGMTVEMTQTSQGVIGHKYTDASVAASWAIVRQSGRGAGFIVSRRERNEALAALRESFGPGVMRGPRAGMNDLNRGAATLAWFLTQDLSAVAHPRDFSPRRP
jgi:hypothetical protein